MKHEEKKELNEWRSEKLKLINQAESKIGREALKNALKDLVNDEQFSLELEEE